MAEPQPTPDEWAWADPALRERIRQDPAGVLKDRGINVPAGVPVPYLHEVVRMSYLLWLDGRVVPVSRFYIDPSDEGLLFGSGVWESTRTVNGAPWLWDRHLDRMRQTVALLGLDVAPQRLPDAAEVTRFVKGLTSQDVVVRLNASAGRPGMTGIVWMTASLRPFSTAPVRLQTVPSPVPKGQPYLTWKTFQYATRLRVGRQAWTAGFDTALLYDPDDNLLEAAHANLFLRLPEGWVTPTADGGLLPGTVRQHLLEKSPLPVKEAVVPRARVPEVREAFLTNSNVGVIPVTQIDGHPLPVGAETQYLSKWLLPEGPGGGGVLFVNPRA